MIAATIRKLARQDNKDPNEHAFIAKIPIAALHVYRKLKQDQILKAFYAVLANEHKHLEDKAFLAIKVNGIQIPRTYKEAVNDKEHSAKWLTTIKEEIRALIANGTWKEFMAPKGANLVITKWVFTIKLNIDGMIKRYKARLVACGFT